MRRILSPGASSALALCVFTLSTTSLLAGDDRARGANALAEQAQAVLKTHCYRCHGQDGRSEGGLNIVTDLARLVESKRVIPGDPAGSKLLKRMVSGEMPPEADFEDATEDAPDLPRLKPEETKAVESWIAGGAPVASTGAATPLLSDLEVLKLVATDLDSIGPRERRFTRYFTLVHLQNAGYGPDQLQSYRHGLSKLVNGLSWNRVIRVPKPIDPAGVVLRIDLRDYLWDVEIWQTIVESDPYALAYQGKVAESIRELTECDLPLVRADWFVFAASRPPLYDRVLRLPETVEELERKLDVDAAANIQQDRVARAGFNASGVSRHNRVIERHESAHGAYWRSYDFAGSADRRNIFAHPLGPGHGEHDFEPDGGEAIFALPNGLNGYMLMDGHGARIDRGPTEIVRDNKSADGSVVNGISCMSCHNRGLIEKADQVRELVGKTRAFDEAVTENIQAIYPPQDRLAELFRDDLARFARAVKQTGSSLSQTEPVFALARQFEEDLNLKLAAAEAGLSVDAFRELLEKTPELGQALGLLLVEGTVKRDAYVAAFPLIAEARHLSSPDRDGRARRPSPTAGPATSGRWVVLFRGRDPKAWNTRSDGSCYARPLSEAPADMHYLRLRRLDTNEALIIPSTREGLSCETGSHGVPSSSPYRWCGTNTWNWGSNHLGIAEGPKISGFDHSGRGKCAVQVEGVDFWAGSGFGHIAHGDESRQHYGWRGQQINPCDFEIAVARGPLSAGEKAALAYGGETSGHPPASSHGTPSLGARPTRPGPGAKAYDAARLLDLPPNEWGRERDVFRDVAPAGAVLVGVNLRVADSFGGSIGAVQPIYLKGRTRTTGDGHGGATGHSFEVVAKPGYAVGAIQTRTGLLMDALQLVFMRRKDDRLDPNDSYLSPWFGDTQGGSAAIVSGEGRLVLGLHGRAEREVRALGLIVAR